MNLRSCFWNALCLKSLEAKAAGVVVKLRTKVFDLYNKRYASLVELTQAMGISTSQIYRVRHRDRTINEKFIIGAIKAFPRYRFGDLFYVVPDGSDNY